MLLMTCPRRVTGKTHVFHTYMIEQKGQKEKEKKRKPCVLRRLYIVLEKGGPKGKI